MREDTKIIGNFSEALEILISSLRRAKNGSKLAHDLLQDWDERLGNDWFTSTRKQDEEKLC